jgi:hypothetical protein
MVANSILLNASGLTVNTSTPGFFVTPINATGETANALIYNTTTNEIAYSTKTFVIDHPLNPEKYLVHGCLEGPEAGVYYRGLGTIYNNICVITLPKYTEKFYDFTICF